MTVSREWLTGHSVHDRLDHVQEAARILAVNSGAYRVRLSFAVKEFWAGVFDPDDWPADLWVQANRIVDKVMADGPMEVTLSRMDQAAARRLGDQIVQLATDIRDARVHGPAHGHGIAEEAVPPMRGPHSPP